MPNRVLPSTKTPFTMSTLVLPNTKIQFTIATLVVPNTILHGLTLYLHSRGFHVVMDHTIIDCEGAQVSWATLLLDLEGHPSVMGYRTSVPEGTQCCGLPYLCSRVTYDQTMPGSEALPILYAIEILPSICHQNLTHKEVVLMPYAIRLFPVQRPCPYYVPSESVTLRGFGHAILYQSIPGVEILPMPCAL